MPSYDVVDGQVIGAPAKVQKAWADFQGQKAPMSSVGSYRDQANAEARAKGQKPPFGKNSK
jgi:hypothetical protein